MLGARFHVTIASLLSAIILSVLLIASHMTIGILSAGIIMKTKQGNPLTWVFSWLTQLVSGVFYPLKASSMVSRVDWPTLPSNLLPGWNQIMSPKRAGLNISPGPKRRFNPHIVYAPCNSHIPLCIQDRI